MHRISLIIGFMTVAIFPASAAEKTWTPDSIRASSSSSNPDFNVKHLRDRNVKTGWSSVVHAVAQTADTVTFWYAKNLSVSHPTNEVKLAACFKTGIDSAVGFPVEFNISWSDSTNRWRSARGFTHFARPSTRWITLPLDTLVNAVGIRITASVLGDDGTGHYAFQLSEVAAGYNDTLEGFEYPADSLRTSSDSLGVRWRHGHRVNYVKLKPRFAGGVAQSFPKSFRIDYLKGSRWVNVADYKHFATPRNGDSIVLPLPQTVTTNEIQIVPTEMGSGDPGSPDFQRIEVSAGFNPVFDHFKFIRNNDSAGRIEIENAGSESINRGNQLGHYDFDARGVVIDPLPRRADPPFRATPHPHRDGDSFLSLRNIYAPSVVRTGDGAWNIYFGGWDSTPDCRDRISMTTTRDNFLTFGAHPLTMDGLGSPGGLILVNNPSVVKTPGGDWRMLYTGCRFPCSPVDAFPDTNSTAYATSTDGVTWTPNPGSYRNLLKMKGYAHWDGDDVNGSNVLYWDAPGKLWHYFFTDRYIFPTVHHATSRAVEDTFAYDRDSTLTHSWYRAVNDVKSFAYGGTTYYMASYNANTDTLWTTVNTDIDSLIPTQAAFANFGGMDTAITTSGWVQDGHRIYGILYGASPYVSCNEKAYNGATSPATGCDSALTLTANRIYARWLQKKVIFQNSRVRWGDTERGYGPDMIHLPLPSGESLETGRFYVYDTDGQTLLYRSPVVTARAGDIWRYSPAP